MSRTDFRRVGLGFWGSLWDWCLEFALCRFGIHEVAAPERDDLTPHCLRCGTAGLVLRGEAARNAKTPPHSLGEG